MKSFYLLYESLLNLIPQMSPMNWFFLMTFFSFAFLLVTTKLHFMKYV